MDYSSEKFKMLEKYMHFENGEAFAKVKVSQSLST